MLAFDNSEFLKIACEVAFEEGSCWSSSVSSFVWIAASKLEQALQPKYPLLLSNSRTLSLTGGPSQWHPSLTFFSTKPLWWCQLITKIFVYKQLMFTQYAFKSIYINKYQSLYQSFKQVFKTWRREINFPFIHDIEDHCVMEWLKLTIVQ